MVARNEEQYHDDDDVDRCGSISGEEGIRRSPVGPAGERRPLLRAVSFSDADAAPVPPRPGCDPSFDDDGGFERYRRQDSGLWGNLMRDEMSGMARLAAPVILTYLLEMLPRMFTIVLVGRVEGSHDRYDRVVSGADGRDEASMRELRLDAASLAIMFTNVVSIAPGIGMLSAMDTLCSQAHGARQPAKMGTYLLTGLAVVSSMFVASALLVWNTSSLLLALGQPAEVARPAGDFARVLLPGFPFLFLYELMRKVFQARNEAAPMLVAAVACNAINVLLGYYLVRWTGLGWMGAAAARAVGNVLLVPCVLMALSLRGEGAASASKVRCSKAGAADHDESAVDNAKDGHHLEVVGPEPAHGNNSGDGGDQFLRHLWEGFVFRDALSIDAIAEFVSFGFPGMLQLVLEWSAFEVIALLCGILPGREAIVGIGANTVINNVSSLVFMFYLGASVSGNVRVGNALGAGDARRARIAANLTLGLSGAMATFGVAFLLAFRNYLPWLFTADADIVEKSRHVFLVVALFQIPDALNAAVQGVFRGSGRQVLGAKVNFVAYYVVSIPLAYLMGVRLHMGVEGLWLGITVGLCAIAIGCTIIVLQSDWKGLATQAASRLNR